MGDFNGDHKLDLAFSIGGMIYVGLGNGNGTFKSYVPYGSDHNAGAMAVGDFNRDGILDIVAANFNR